VYRNALFAMSLGLASTATAQSPQRFGADHPVVGRSHSIGTLVTRGHQGHSPQKEQASCAETVTATSTFRAQVRGAIATNTFGDAQFGAVPAGDRSPAAFVVSLGVGSPQGAILFTRRDGTPLGVGRHRISDPADGADEVQALLLTGSTTNPTGVFRGRSGWLIVTAASDRLLTGRFEVDGVGFQAAEPQREDRLVTLTGSFSATPAGSSF
jgi:hypothetical protein